jgi:hypothetical protein
MSLASASRIRYSDGAEGRFPDIGSHREVLPDPRPRGRPARTGPVERNVAGERHACSKKPPRSRGGVVTTPEAAFERLTEFLNRMSGATVVSGEDSDAS